MKTPLQLDDLNLDAAAKIQVAARVQSLLDQAKSETAKYYEADLHAKDLKIQALILELAHLRRIRYGVKKEALSSLQRDVLRDICNEDIAALEAEVEQIEDDQVNATATKPKRPRAGRQPLPPHLPRNHHRSTDSARYYRWRHGSGGFADLGHGQQIPGSSTALPSGTNRRSRQGYFGQIHPGGMGRPHRCGITTRSGSTY